MVCSGSIFAASLQPQPVFSSSNGSFSVRSPSEAIYRAGRTGDHPLPHGALAAVIDVEFHAFQRCGGLDRIEGLGLLGCGRKHPHLVDGARIEQAEIVFRS